MTTISATAVCEHGSANATSRAQFASAFKKAFSGAVMQAVLVLCACQLSNSTATRPPAMKKLGADCTAITAEHVDAPTAMQRIKYFPLPTSGLPATSATLSFTYPADVSLSPGLYYGTALVVSDLASWLRSLDTPAVQVGGTGNGGMVVLLVFCTGTWLKRGSGRS